MKKFLAIAIILALCLAAIPACAEYYCATFPLLNLKMDVVLPEDYDIFARELLEDEALMSDLGEFGDYMDEIFTDETMAACLFCYSGEFDLYITESDADGLDMNNINDMSLKISDGLLDLFSKFTPLEPVADTELIETPNHQFLKTVHDDEIITYITTANDRCITLIVIPLTESGEISPSQQIILTNILDSIYIYE